MSHHIARHGAQRLSASVLASFPVEKVCTCCLRLTFSCPPTSHLSLMALPLVCFTVLQKSRTLPPWGHLSYENAAVDDDECFNQLAYCSEQVVEPWGTEAPWKAVTHNLNDYSSRHDKDSWLCAVSCWGLKSEKSEGHWLEMNLYELRMMWKHQSLYNKTWILSFKSKDSTQCLDSV